jgi:hypothetical protein
MSGLTWRRALGVWFLLAAGMLLLGGFRGALTSNKDMDPKFVAQVADCAGAIIVLVATFYLVDKLETEKTRDLLLVGGVWVVLITAVDILFGRYVLHHEWAAIFQDYDLLDGRLWLLVLTAFFVGPFLTTRLHGVEERDEQGYLRR